MKPANALNIIVPALNEARGIAAMLGSLQAARAGGCRVVVVDGGSRDDTPRLADPLADQVLSAERGRASQMQAGTDACPAGDFWFLHADTLVAPPLWQVVARTLAEHPHTWGRFDVNLAGDGAGLRVIAATMNRRSRWTGIATGDQGIFVRREAFEAVGGMPQQPLMEDVELSRRLKRLRRPACRRETVTTSARRWEQRGVVRTILLMWSLRAAYALGASPRWLERRYRTVR